jgi:hypothetical protein
MGYPSKKNFTLRIAGMLGCSLALPVARFFGEPLRSHHLKASLSPTLISSSGTCELRARTSSTVVINTSARTVPSTDFITSIFFMPCQAKLERSEISGLLGTLVVQRIEHPIAPPNSRNKRINVYPLTILPSYDIAA